MEAPSVDSAHLYARSVLTNATILSMQAANQRRQHLEQAPAYGEQSFLDVRNDLDKLLRRKGLEK